MSAEERQSSGRARRVGAVSAAAIAVIAAAIGLTIWRYQVAVSLSASALDKRGDAKLSDELIGSFWRERALMNEYLNLPSPAVAAEISAERGRFARIDTAITPETSAAAQARARAIAANSALYAAFASERADAGGSSAQVAGAIQHLNRQTPASLGPLVALASL